MLTRVYICFRLQKRARRSSPERAQTSKKDKGQRPIRREEDEESEPESESASESESESEAGALPHTARGGHMDDAEFERRNIDRVKAAIERKSASKGVSPCPLHVPWSSTDSHP